MPDPTYYTTNSAWTNWAEAGTGTASTTINYCWSAWTTSGTSNGNLNVLSGINFDVSEIEKREKARKEAEVKAESLLEACLTPEQLKTMKAMASFIVLSESGKQYKVIRKPNYGVQELDSAGAPVSEFCLIARDPDTPLADQLLVQKLMLEANEQEFLRMANKRALAQIRF